GIDVVRGQELAHALVQLLAGCKRRLPLPGLGEVLREAVEAGDAQLERLEQRRLIGLELLRRLERRRLRANRAHLREVVVDALLQLREARGTQVERLVEAARDVVG